MSVSAVDLGWWQWAGGGDAGDLGQMWHIHTGERLVHRGPIDPAQRASLGADLHADLREAATLHRFDYLHEELDYPLILSVTPDFSRLELDHTASAALWRAEVGAAEHFPRYGAFCRVDDAALEAFRIWPSERRQGDGQGRLILHGGWFNGCWQAGLKRSTWTFSQDVVQWAFETRRSGPVDPAPPPLAPLDAVPQRWEKKVYRGDAKIVPGTDLVYSNARFSRRHPDSDNRFRRPTPDEAWKNYGIDLSRTTYFVSGRNEFAELLNFEDRAEFRLRTLERFFLDIPILKTADIESLMDRFHFGIPEVWEKDEDFRDRLRCATRATPGAEAGPVNGFVHSPISNRGFGREPFSYWADLGDGERFWPIGAIRKVVPDFPSFMHPLYAEYFDYGWGYQVGQHKPRFGATSKCGAFHTFTPETCRLLWRDVATVLALFPVSETVGDRIPPDGKGPPQSEAQNTEAVYLSDWFWIGNFYPDLHRRLETYVPDDGATWPTSYGPMQDCWGYLDFHTIPREPGKFDLKTDKYRFNHMTIEGWSG